MKTDTITSQNIGLSSWITLYKYNEGSFLKTIEIRGDWLALLQVPRRPLTNYRPGYSTFIIDHLRAG
jgi:hypothetical protein